MKGGHALVGSITSNSWLVLSSSVHCVSVVLVAVYCRIEWCVSQPQSALAFRLAQLRALVFKPALLTSLLSIEFISHIIWSSMGWLGSSGSIWVSSVVSSHAVCCSSSISSKVSFYFLISDTDLRYDILLMV